MKRRENKNALYFIAILTPDNVSKVINEYKNYFKDTYRVSRALNSPPHITLFPPFRWPVSKIGILNTSLRKFSEIHQGMYIHMQGFGAFRPRVIYTGISENEPLKMLWQALATWLQKDIQLGTGPDQRGFHPHITLAFKDLTSEIFYKAWPEFKDRQLDMQFFAEQLSLLKHNGRQWEVLRDFPLNESLTTE